MASLSTCEKVSRRPQDRKFQAYHEGAIRVLEGGVGRQDGVVRLNDGVGHRGRGVHAELELGLLAIVGGKALEDESTEARTSSTTKRVEDKEPLQTRAVVSETADTVHHVVNQLLSDGIMTASIYCRWLAILLSKE